MRINFDNLGGTQLHYDEITLNWDDADVARQLQAISMTCFQLENHPVFVRNKRGELVPATPGSPEAGYKRDRSTGLLMKM